MPHTPPQRKKLGVDPPAAGLLQFQELVAGLAAPLVDAHLLVALGAAAVAALLDLLGVRS
jgi:hypothetical protein